MNKLTNKHLTIINFVIVTYFILAFLIIHYKIDHVLIGVFWELLTIPFILAQVIFLGLSIIFLIRKKPNVLTIISMIALAVSTYFTLGKSFF